MNLDEIEARVNAATPGPWTYHDGCGYVEVPPCGAIEFKPGWERSVHFLARVHNNHVEGEDGLGFDGAFIAHARTDVPALIARVRELEAECERMRTFAAQNFSAMIRQEAEQMREYGLSYEGVRKVLREYDNAELSFGKVMDLIRAAARAMAEDNQRAVSNLLAIIHGDGGHYEGKHGTVKACKDAEGVVSDLRVRLDAATYKRSGCKCQWEAGDSPCPIHGDNDE